MIVPLLVVTGSVRQSEKQGACQTAKARPTVAGAILAAANRCRFAGMTAKSRRQG